MTAPSAAAERFVRRTRLGPDEYRKNFRQFDGEIIAAVTSAEADAVTPLMSKVYLRLANASKQYWEREGVLRFAGEKKDGRWVTAWEQLVALSGVSSATARKALRWMHDQGVVGYFAGKNGVGVRIFLNRAASSIGRRPAPGQKNLRLVRASGEAPRTSADDTPFRDSFADSEVLEKDLNPRAPKNGADDTGVVKSFSSPARSAQTSIRPAVLEPPTAASAEELTELLLGRLEPAMRAAAAQAAAREHERTREWLETKGLPKAARVAQREAYNVLRKYGVATEPAAARAPQAEVGRGGYTPPRAQPLAEDEVEELAQACVAMLEAKGQAVEVTLSEMSAEAGGFLLPEDAPRLRRKVQSLLGAQLE
jgi:hypothetical protein